MPAAGPPFAVAGCPVQEHADPFGLRAGVDQQINSRRLTGRRFSQTRLSYHTADERTALSGTLPLDVCFGSWPCDNADVLRHRRMVFLCARCSLALARGSPLRAHRYRGAEARKLRRSYSFGARAHALPFMLIIRRAERD